MFIYCITNIVNDKKYIGLTTKSLKERFAQHKTASLKNNKTPIYQAMREIGRDNFSIELLDDTAQSLEELSKLEDQYIVAFDTFYPNGYNLLSSCTPYEFTIEDAAEQIYAIKKAKNNGTYDKKTSSQYVGVYFSNNSQRWTYTVNINNKKYHKKNFMTEKDAAIARDIFVTRKIGNTPFLSKMLNFPENIKEYLNNTIREPRRIMKRPLRKSTYNFVSYNHKWNHWYVVIINENRKRIKKGMFSDEKDAALAGDILYLRYHFNPNYSSLNFPENINKYAKNEINLPLSEGEKVQNKNGGKYIQKTKCNTYEVNLRNYKLGRKRFQTLQEAQKYRDKALAHLSEQ